MNLWRTIFSWDPVPTAEEPESLIGWLVQITNEGGYNNLYGVVESVEPAVWDSTSIALVGDFYSTPELRGTSSISAVGIPHPGRVVTPLEFRGEHRYPSQSSLKLSWDVRQGPPTGYAWYDSDAETSFLLEKKHGQDLGGVLWLDEDRWVVFKQAHGEFKALTPGGWIPVGDRRFGMTEGTEAYFFATLEQAKEKAEEVLIPPLSLEMVSSQYPGGSGWINPQGIWYSVPYASHGYFAAKSLGYTSLGEHDSYKAIEELLQKGWIRVSRRTLEVWDPIEVKDSLIEYFGSLSPSTNIEIEIDKNKDWYQGTVKDFKAIFLGEEL